jgi:PAS domain S-box-containing protein
MSKVKSIFFQIIKRKESLLFPVLLIAGISLPGWLFGKIGLAAISSAYIPIAPVTAIIFIILCILFFVTRYQEKSRLTKSLVTFLVIIIAFFCGIMFLNHTFNLPWDIENVFIKNPDKLGSVQIGHMSPITSVLFVFICIVILLRRNSNSNVFNYIGAGLSLLVCLASSALLIGYLYNAPYLYGSSIIPVSLPASICLFLFSITLLRIFEFKFWTLNLIKPNLVTLQLLRSFLPAAVLTTILQGFLITNFPVVHENLPLSVALICLSVVTLIVFVVIRVSRGLGNDLVKAEQELRESESKYRFLVENAGDGIGIVNLNEEFIFANSAAERIFGVDEGELIGKNLKVFLTEEESIKIINQTKIRENSQVSSYDIQLTLPDGNNRIIHLTGVPHLDDDEKVIGTLGAFRDITELKKVEKQLLQLNADKDRFISILGHDLKNPFNNILGFCEILTNEIKGLNKNEIKDIAENIHKSARITSKLLEDILMWAKTQQGKIAFEQQSLNFKDIFPDTLEILNPAARAKNISVNCIAADQLTVFADLNMLKTILRNLVSNAIKFTNNGGAITVNAVQDSENVTISVSDNGVGIPPENLAKLFDISQVLTTTGTAEEGGTGLGLLLCKEFVEKHGGKIWAESEVGKGSDFKFTLHAE